MGASIRRLRRLSTYAGFLVSPDTTVFLHSWAECKSLGRRIAAHSGATRGFTGSFEPLERLVTVPTVLMGKLRLTEVLTLGMSIRTLTPYGN